MKKILLFILSFITLTALAAGIDPARKLLSTQRIIEAFYVDKIDTTAITESAIRAMLKELDPHSAYSTPDETRELNEPLQGNFSGIGIQFQMLNDTLYVIQTISGGPSEQVGILAGDRILRAGDSVISGMKRPNSSIMKLLRGPKGTTVDVTALRGRDTIDFHITRNDIPIYSVDASFMVTPSIGYIRLSRFAEETPDEMRKAIKELNKNGMTSLILDLQDNTGGYLHATCEVAEMFLPKGSPIVSTEGRATQPQYYNSQQSKPLFDGPLAVLVNQYSASAAEILAGAIQDNDRGIIVGRRTFGKGLVQRPFPFPDGSMIRLTIARYHTPSGRCIQKPYAAGDDDSYRRDLLNRFNSGELSSADSAHHFSDSLLYHTLRLNRPVYGGGGIQPDSFVALDTTQYSPYYRKLLAKGIFNRFTANYIDSRRKELKKQYPTPQAFADNFEVTTALLDDFTSYGASEGIELDAEGFDRSREIISKILKGLIGRDIHDQATYWRVITPLDPVYKRALEILSGPSVTGMLR